MVSVCQIAKNEHIIGVCIYIKGEGLKRDSLYLASGKFLFLLVEVNACIHSVNILID